MAVTLAMSTVQIVSPQEWEAARQQLLVKEKTWTGSPGSLAAERRRMPWLAVEKTYEFDGPEGEASLLDLFAGRRQLIVYRAFPRAREGLAGRLPADAAVRVVGLARRVRRLRRSRGQDSSAGIRTCDTRFRKGQKGQF